MSQPAVKALDLPFELAWARLFTPDGDLVLTRAEAAEAAEAEVARLRALLQKL